MPPLVDKWNILKDEDRDLFPLLQVSIVIVAHLNFFFSFEIQYSIPT